MASKSKNSGKKKAPSKKSSSSSKTVTVKLKKDSGKKLDFDPEEMIIYSEILKPKF